MKKSTILTTIMVLVGLIVWGCGGDTVQKSTEVSYGTQVISTASALPTCTVDTEGQLYYVQDAEEFQYCTAGSYSAIDITGPQGDAGVDGTDGTDGVIGEDGLNSIIRVSYESPGDNCTYGGKRIEVGLDADGDSILDAGEINNSATAYICTAYSELSAWYGNVVIDTTDDITEIAGYDIIVGDLTISSDTLTDIDGLSSIVVVTGQVHLNSSSLLNTNGLSNLVRANSLVIEGTALTSVNFNSLTTITSKTIEIGASSTLLTIDFDNIIELESLAIYNNSALTSITMNNIEIIDQSLAIGSNPLLTTLNLGSLCSVGLDDSGITHAFYIADNAELCQSDVDTLKTQVVNCGGLNWTVENISGNKTCP